MTEDDARKIAIYLFTHKWLAPAYSKQMEELLVKDILEALASDGDDD